jgi:phosphinothricin acetyltransferase
LGRAPFAAQKFSCIIPTAEQGVMAGNDSDVVIRPARVEDLPAITEIYNDAIRNTVATFDTEPKTLDQQRVWFDGHSAQYPILVAERDGQVVGWSSLSPWSDRCAYRETAESSFYVQDGYRGKGIGRKLKVAIIAAAEKAGLHVILARIAEGNAASLHLNEECGFEHIGVMKEVGCKFGRRLNVHLMQKILGDSAT